jgi:enoyl-CoA hydratase/carnithine racemase
MFNLLKVDEGDNGLTRVVMDRPPANALSDELIDELTQCAEQIQKASPRVVILSSSAPMFMAGADLKGLNADWEGIAARLVSFQNAANQWELIPCPTIALINGHALGAGCEMSLVCDFRIMARGKARIGLPEVLRALLAGGGGTQRTLRLLGRQHALNLNLRGLMLDADAAEKIGLVTQAVEADELEAKGMELANELLGLPKMSLAAIKRCILQGENLALMDGLTVERNEMMGLGKTHDSQEGVQAFVQKREPVWEHR